LQIGDGGTSGSIGAGTVSLGLSGKLVVNRSDTVTITQSLVGVGTFETSGKTTSLVKLTADNSGFGGTTIIKSGTLEIGNGAVTLPGVIANLRSAGSGSFVNDAELLVTRSGSLAIAGTISGSGKLAISGAAVSVTLEGRNDFTGITEVVGGTLKLAAGASIEKSSIVKLQSGALLDVSAFDATGGFSVASGQSLKGDGGVIRGSVVLSGDLEPGNSPGSMNIVGNLLLNPNATALYKAQFDQSVKTGTRNDLITVTADASAAGIFSLNGGTISGGTYYSGASQTSGTLHGTLSLGTVIATSLSRVVKSESYTIVQAGSVDGTFKSVDSRFFGDNNSKDNTQETWMSQALLGRLRDAGVGAVVSAGALNVVSAGSMSTGASALALDISQVSGNTAVLQSSLKYTPTSVVMEVERKTFRSLGIGINAKEVGGYLDSFVENPGDLLALEVQLEMVKNANSVAAALAGAGVSAYADLMTISRRRMLDLASGLGSRLDLLGLQGAVNGGVETNVGTGETGWSVWQSSSVSQLTRKAVYADGFGGYNASGQSSVMGLERPLGDGRVGLIGAIGSTNADFTLPNTSIKSESWHLGAYMSTPVAPFFADIAFIYGRVDNDARRNIEVPGYTARTRALFSSDEYTLRLGGGIQIMPAQSAWEITPTEHLLYVSGMQAAFEETGAGVLSQGGGLGARIGSAKMSGLINEVGLTVGRRWVVRGVPVAVRLQANWQHDFDGNGAVQASFVGAPVSAGRFTARNTAGDCDALKLNTSIEVNLTKRLSLRIGGEYERRKSSSKTSLSISVGMEF
jgi:uncharacterized protein with beta-barrel porin domain